MEKIRIFFLAASAVFLIQGISLALDPESIDCIRCHTAMAPENLTVCPLPECDHPIGTDYLSVSMTNKGLRPPEALPPSIRLVNGQIGCITCHVPYSPENHQQFTELRKQYPQVPDPMLVTENRKSELCMSCHIK